MVSMDHLLRFAQLAAQSVSERIHRTGTTGGV
jgi:hypothetical protein